MRRRKPSRKPMPKPSRPFADKRRKHLEAAWRKMLERYHGMFVDRRLDD